MKIEARDLTPALWPDLEKLFGKNGACGGCWCMWWRIEQGEKWDAVKGPSAKRRWKKLVTSGRAHGVLAYVDSEPVGWCAYGPRPDFSKLERARTLACDDSDRVWSLPCFYIKVGFRGRGVASALLQAALGFLKKRGAKLAEGYPVNTRAPDKSIPAAFAWTGTRRLFDAAGFAVVGNQGGGKERVRKTL